MKNPEKTGSGKYGHNFFLLLICFATIPSFGTGYNGPPTEQLHSPFSLQSGSYVIAGVFRYFDNAVRYSDYLFAKGHETRYGYYPPKGYFYVYLNYYDNYNQAKSACLQFRKYNELKEAWVAIFDNNSSKYIFDLISNIPANQHDQAAVIAQPVDNEPNQDIAVSTEQITLNTAAAKNYNFLFSTYDARNHSKLAAKVEIVNPAKLQLISLADAHKVHTIEMLPGSSSLLVIGQHFGYKKVERLIDLSNIKGSSPDISLNGDTIQVNFDMVRLKTGDVAIMYNVYFFNDAAVMRPESRYEVNHLLDMLRENDEYIIRIHGHTNGNNSGPIIRMRDNDTNFFELSRNNKTGRSSARELSKERANTIYRYLVSQGIDKKRMQTIGWGGRKMLYEQNDPNARKNVRVEIEILAH
jgi:outer membrane protein OmpA-like peptidoglycan-associated protein